MSIFEHFFRRLFRKQDRVPSPAHAGDGGRPESSPPHSPSTEAPPDPSDESTDLGPSPRTDVRKSVVRAQKEKHARRQARRAAEKAEAIDDASKKGSGKSPSVNRNRIPIIGEAADLYDVFGLREPEETDSVAFQTMMDAALSRTDMDAVAAEKEAGLHPEKPRSLKARIKSYPPPQEVLDLHGCTAMDAVAKVESFVQTGRGTGLKTVKIIVGKGRHSEEAAVLPRVVRSQLDRMKHRRLVLTYEWEKGAERRSGALVVYLT